MTGTVAELLVSCLESEGVENVFGVPGEELEDLLFALRDSSVTFVPVRHEQGAAFMANVHGRLTGEAGVCLATLGPGATNLITGVADAQLDKAPLVAVTGQGGRERLHKESHQKLDVVHAFGPLVKWNAQLSDAEATAETVRKAFKVAQHEKPGATHVEVPEDVAAEEVEGEPLPDYGPVARPAPDDEALAAAVETIESAERPLVLAGNGAVRTDAAAALRSFVDETGMPVVGTYMGKGALSDRDERSLMTLDSGPDDEAARAVERADCVLAIGYDIAEHDPAGWNPDRDKRVVHLDVEPAEVYAHYTPDVEVVSDPSAGLERLADAVDGEWDVWCADAHERVYEHATRTPRPDDPVTVSNTLPLLREAMADADVLISDVGSHKLAIARDFPTYEPGRCVISNGLASMGIGVPGGLAADLALEDDVVVATGDGGFLMNAAELETATRLGCSFTVVVYRDDEYGVITEHQEEHRGESFGTRFTNPDLVAFAESFGVPARRVESLAEFGEALDAVDSDELSLVEVVLDG
ncbi:acetolactate synthase large subunit [Halorarum halophilum]|uniref:Acetolactate synthase large subunit n=1 Tax=Halorarum halophilum TaxID=2743090 RepID=A0A7D5K6U6_9EURY|nr:acetolactate synthase large subunit [Halobaculum halophilum]QLG27039.1 acetolactate synthase large subunit [Halobaculum halophilum]